MRGRLAVAFCLSCLAGLLPPAAWAGGAASAGEGNRPATTDALLELKRNRLAEWKRQIAVLQKRANSLAAREKSLNAQIATARKQRDALKKEDRTTTGNSESQPSPDRADPPSDAPALADRLSTASAELSRLAVCLGPVRPVGGALPAALSYAAREAAGVLRNRDGGTSAPKKAGEKKGPTTAPGSTGESNRAALEKLDARIGDLTAQLVATKSSRKALLVQANQLAKLRQSVEREIARLDARRKAAQREAAKPAKPPEADPPPAAGQNPPKPTGSRTTRKDVKKGTGLDVLVPERTDIHAVEAGRVVYADRFEGYGNLVILEHSDGALSLYGFLSEILVRGGRSIARGERIGKSGFIEDRDRPGLRFEVRMLGTGGSGVIDPNSWLPEGVDFRRRLLGREE